MKNIADDIIVYGKTREEHDNNLDKCLKRLFDRGFRLNKSKCSFLSQTLQFFGQTFSADGIKPDPTRILDLQNAPKPNNVHDVRSLLGMANYSSRYIANFATITAPLRELTKKNVKFEWNKIQQIAFDILTAAFSSAQCMAYFDSQKNTYITVDASPVGISAILSQKTKGNDNEKVVSYASRARGGSRIFRTLVKKFFAEHRGGGGGGEERNLHFPGGNHSYYVNYSKT